MENAAAPAKSRVVRISLGRVFNLGNYENARYDITVDIGIDDNPADTLRSLEGILSDLNAKSPVENYQLRTAQEMLAKSSEQLTDRDKEKIPEYRAVIAKHEEALQRRQAAREALNTLHYQCEFKDAKRNYEDENY